MFFIMLGVLSFNCYSAAPKKNKNSDIKITRCDTPIESVSWSPDGKSYVTTNGNKLLFWDSETDKLIMSKSDYNASILSVKFSKDGSSIVIIYNDNTFVVEGLTEENSYHIHQRGISAIPVLDAVFYKNYYTLLMPLDGQNIYKFMCLLAINDSSITEMLKSNSYVYSIDIDRQDENVAVTYSDGKIKIINIDSKRVVQEVQGNPKEIIAARFNRTGSYFIYSEDERTLKVKAVTGKKEFIIKDYDRPINRADFAPNGKSVVAADKNGFVKIYNIEQGFVEDAIELDYGDVAYNCQFSPNGETVLIGTKNGNVIKWKPKYRKLAVAGYGIDGNVDLLEDGEPDSEGQADKGAGHSLDESQNGQSGEGGDGENSDADIVYKRRPLFDGKGGIFNQVVELNTHNLYIGAGFGSISSKNFVGNIKLKTGYKNYSFYPFFWGGNLGVDVGLTSNKLPFKYQINGKPVPPPTLVGIAPSGVAGIHYLFQKPNILLFAELAMGVNIRMLATTGYIGPPAVSFFTEIGVGIEWKFLRAEIDAQIDTNFNFSINGTIGGVIKLFPNKTKKIKAGGKK